MFVARINADYDLNQGIHGHPKLEKILPQFALSVNARAVARDSRRLWIELAHAPVRSRFETFARLRIKLSLAGQSISHDFVSLHATRVWHFFCSSFHSVAHPESNHPQHHRPNHGPHPQMPREHCGRPGNPTRVSTVPWLLAVASHTSSLCAPAPIVNSLSRCQ